MHKIAPFKNGTIKYTDSGKGRAVVFLHGFLESLEMWRYYADHLPKHIRTICIDLPGHGKSDNFGYTHPMELMAESVRAVLKQERIRKCIIVGHSMGGYTGLAFAEMYPDMLTGLVLYFSSASADDDEKKRNRTRTIDVVKHSPHLFVSNSIPFLFSDKNKVKYAKSIAILVKRASKMSRQSIIAALEGMRDRQDREIVLKFAPFPVKFVVGDIDPVLPVKDLIRQSKLPRLNSITVLKDTAHMGFIENKKATYVAVKDFINTVY